MATKGRYAVQVIYPTGEEVYLRHGARIGHGAIVRFPNKQTAEINADFVRQGLDRGYSVNVVRVSADVS